MTPARSIVLLVLCASLVAVSAAVAASGQTLDSRAGIGYVSSSHGYAVWSRRVGPNRYRLVVRRHGATRFARVAPRRVPFDVSVGRDGRGRVVAVYSRCRSEASGSRSSTGELTDYASATDCSLRALDLRRGAERRVRLRGGLGVRSRFMPSIARGRIAYAALHRTRAGLQQGVFVQTIDTGRPRRLRGGTTFPNTPENGPLGVAFDGRRVSYAWRLIESPCSSPEDLLGESTELWSDDLERGTHRLVRRAGCPDDIGRRIFSPILRGSSLQFIEARMDGTGTTEIGRSDLRNGRLELAPAPTDSLSIARYGARYLVVLPRGGRDGRARLRRIPLAFQP